MMPLLPLFMPAMADAIDAMTPYAIITLRHDDADDDI